MVTMSVADNDEIEQLLVRCAAQDPAALEKLYKRVAGTLLAVVLRIVRERAHGAGPGQCQGFRGTGPRRSLRLIVALERLAGALQLAQYTCIGRRVLVCGSAADGNQRLSGRTRRRA